MFDILNRIDLNILLWIQENLRFDFVTVVLKYYTDVGNSILAFIVIYLLINGLRYERIISLIAIVSVGVEVVTVNGLLKNIIARERPFVASDEVIPLIDILSEFSFPSGHTALAFAMAFVFYRFFPKKYGRLAIVIAMLVGLSRVYLGVHYLSDIVGGIVIAYLSSRMAEFIVRKLVLKL